MKTTFITAVILSLGLSACGGSKVDNIAGQWIQDDKNTVIPRQLTISPVNQDGIFVVKSVRGSSDLHQYLMRKQSENSICTTEMYCFEIDTAKDVLTNTGTALGGSYEFKRVKP